VSQVESPSPIPLSVVASEGWSNLMGQALIESYARLKLSMPQTVSESGLGGEARDELRGFTW
jgi:hypothetical protein